MCRCFLQPGTICHNNNYNIDRGCSISLSTGRLALAATKHKEDKQKILHPIFSFLIAAYNCRVCMRTNRKLKKKKKNSIPDPQTLLCFQCCCQATLHYLKSNLPFLHLKHDEEQSDFDRRQEVFLMIKKTTTKQTNKTPTSVVLLTRTLWTRCIDQVYT